MATVRGTAVRWVSEEFPGVIEVQLTDADGLVHGLVDKAPVFGRAGDLGFEAAFPLPVDIAVELVEDVDDDSVLIELVWEASNTERTRFVVRRIDLTL